MVYDAIVVGAGVSGLAAAQKLKEAGLNILVVEARNRLGGRIHTDRSLGFPVDLGASFAHDLPHNPLAQQSETFGLRLFPFSSLLDQFHDHAAYDARYKKVPADTLIKIKNFVNNFFEILISQPPGQDLSSVLQDFSNASLSAEELVVAKGWLANLMSCWAGAELEKTSVELWKNMEDERQQAYVLNGYDKLINFLANDLVIHLNSEVNKIVYTDSTVKVYTQQATYETKKVVLTLPIGVLKKNKVGFFPSLPASKLKVIQAIGSGILEKAVLHFSDCFWDQSMLTIQRFPNEESNVLVYVNCQALMGKTALVALYGSKTLQQLQQLAVKQQSDRMLFPLRRIYGNQYREPTYINFTHWHHDPYAYGAYSYLPRGEAPICYDQLAESVENKLFFAGEATHRKMSATVHGAYLSGLRVAEEILATH